MEKELTDAYDTLMDDSLPIWTRAKQADKLKRYGQFDERAIQAMKDLWNQADNNNERAGILHALKGVVDAEFRDQILTSLADEFRNEAESPKFRYMAVEALETMLPDPVVREWLNYLILNDPDPEIQARARRPLGLGKK